MNLLLKAAVAALALSPVLLASTDAEARKNKKTSCIVKISLINGTGSDFKVWGIMGQKDGKKKWHKGGIVPGKVGAGQTREFWPEFSVLGGEKIRVKVRTHSKGTFGWNTLKTHSFTCPSRGRHEMKISATF